MRGADAQGDYYLLPGGGQLPGESLSETLRRECLEEASAEVEPRDLRLVRDYIGKNHEFAEHDADFHQVELMFECSIRNPEAVKPGSHPDSNQTGIEWLDLSRIEDYRLYPSALKQRLSASGVTPGPVYLGDVN